MSKEQLNPYGSNPYLFLPVEVTREQLVGAARSYMGIEYSPARTYFHEGGAQSDCVGVFLMVSKDVGLLPPDFDINLPYRVWKRAKTAILREILVTNFDILPRERNGQVLHLPGDVVALKYEPGEPRHTAIVTSLEPAPFGSLLHAMDDVTGGGRVYEQHITPLEWKYVHAVYRLKNLKDDAATQDMNTNISREIISATEGKVGEVN